MSVALTPFDYNGQSVRTVMVEGEPWFVLSDLCAVLGLSNPSVVAQRVDASALSQTEISSGGQGRSVTVVSEAGMYEVVIRSDKPQAVAFRRWITTDVLPAIRKTGSYSRELSRLELIELARESELARIEAETRVAQLEPKAKTFDVFLSSTGDYSVNEAAKSLSRDHSILTGERRLFQFMQRIGWIYRDGKGKPIPYQAQVDNGRLVAKPQFHYHPETGEVVADPPQIRVTAKGLEALHQKYMQAAS